MEFSRNQMGVLTDLSSQLVELSTDAFTKGMALRFEPGGYLRRWTAGEPFYGVYTGPDIPAPSAPVFRDVHPHRPGDIYRAAYDGTVSLAVTSATVDTVGIAGLTPTAVNGFIYVCVGVGLGQLRRIVSVAAGIATLSHAWVTIPTIASRVWLIWPRLRRVPFTADSVRLAQSVSEVPLPHPIVIASYMSIGGGAPELMTQVSASVRNGLHEPGVTFAGDVAIQGSIVS